ncbi:hypothetical protein Gohar_026322 [Gossypium harknessii]|uniref:Agenet-like domain-containing protein n=1 Tax=Gossypium harknessii TaxID=34285 RepID=A0A7J9HR63_9ROSI|nr:hypothetical protein [Gossypium harknessii]
MDFTRGRTHSPQALSEFKKGNKVEELTRKEVPTDAWHCAEIISGNGHTYSVKYGWFSITGEAANVERVFDELCWKLALIVFGNNFFVRILGSNSELEVHRSRLRVRQSWEDGKWFLVGKGSSKPLSPKRKISLLGYLDVSGHKKRVIEKGIVGGKRIIVRLPSPTSKKVDAFVSPNNVLGERCRPSSFNRTDDIVSYASSVGSFSGLGNNGLNLSRSYVTEGYENLEDYCSNADSYCERRCRKERSFGYSSGGSGTNFHRSELHVYQQALEALYMSGP